MLVKNRMSHPVITVHPETTMTDALDLMHRENVRRLPVVDKRGNLVGIVAERELLRASPSDMTTLSKWEMQGMLDKVTVEKLMTKDVTTVAEDTPIEEAARLMLDGKVTGLPVMRDGKIVGIITEKDVFKLLLEALGAREPGIRLTAIVPRERGTLVKLAQAIFEAGGDILSFGTFYGESSGDGQFTIKVDGLDEATLRTAVEPYVEQVVDMR